MAPPPIQKQPTALLGIDQNGSVLRALTTSGVQAIGYTPYGHHAAARSALSLCAFNGDSPQRLTGHYLLGNGYRPFSPVLMRFTAPDSMSPFGRGGLNAYMYCSADPINGWDPTGHWTVRQILVRRTANTLQSTARIAPTARRQAARSGKHVSFESGLAQTTSRTRRKQMNSPNYDNQGRLKPGISVEQKRVFERGYRSLSMHDIDVTQDRQTLRRIHITANNTEIRKLTQQRAPDTGEVMRKRTEQLQIDNQTIRRDYRSARMQLANLELLGLLGGKQSIG